MIKNWKAHEKGWDRRYNMLIDEMAEGTDVSEIEFADDEEREWYVKAKKKLDDENERIRKMCEEEGIPVFEVAYDPVELE